MTGTPRKRGPKPSAAPAFLARKAAIAAELDSGYKIRPVYEKYGRQLGISYSQFARYVSQFIRKTPRPKPARAAEASSAPAAENRRHGPLPVAPSHPDPPRKRDGPIIPGTRAPRKFQFDPTAVLRRKDELF